MKNYKINCCFILSIFLIAFADIETFGKDVGFNIGIANSMMKIARESTNYDQLSFSPYIQVQCARDESESFQVAVICDDCNLTNVVVNIKEPVKNGKNLPLRWYKEDYVSTGNPSYQVEYVGWWPDVLMPVNSFNVEKNKIQPLWFTVDVPKDIESGFYYGTIEIRSQQGSKKISLTVQVRNFTLPRPGTLAVPFGLYAKSISSWYCGDLAYEKCMTIEQYDKFCEFLTKYYRVTPKEIGNEFVNVLYKKAEDQTQNKDTNLNAPGQTEPIERPYHDKDVIENVNMDALQKTLGKYKNMYPPYSCALYRLPTGKSILKSLDSNHPITPQEVAEPVIKYFEEWKRQGFTDYVYIYGVDEPKRDNKRLAEFVHDTYAIIKKQIPSAKIMQTLAGAAPEWVGLVDIWCPKINDVALQFYKDRQQAGDIVWTYTCISPLRPHANFEVDEPGIDHRMIFWYTKKVNATGFLYWASTWWERFQPRPGSGKPYFPDAPFDLKQSQFFTDAWQHACGDGLLIYPGKDFTPIPSLRLEIIRDGIEDYEYICLLEKYIKQVQEIPVYKTPAGQGVMSKAKELTQVPDAIISASDSYTQDPKVLLERRKEIGDMIEQLVNILEEKHYKLWKDDKSF